MPPSSSNVILSRLGLTAFINAVSDQQLCDAVDRRFDLMLANGELDHALAAKASTPVPTLHAAKLPVTPIAALHEFAEATLVAGSDPLMRPFTSLGSVLRYAGILDRAADGTLLVDAVANANLRYRARGEFSEDMGIAFGITLAKQWARAAGAQGKLSVVNVDLIFASSSPGYPTRRGAVTAGLQPDYLLREDLPGGGYRFWILECKGTGDTSTRLQQLAKARQQTQALVLGGATLPALAVSTVSTVNGFTSYSIDPEAESPVIYPSDAAIREAVIRIPAPTSRFDEWRHSFDPGMIAARAIAVSCAALALRSGDADSIERWAPWADPRVFGSQRRDRLEGPDGRQYLGVLETSTRRPHGHEKPQEHELWGFSGVATEVVTAMRSGEHSLVREAQGAGEPVVEAVRGSERLVSLGENGTMLAIGG